MAVKQTKKLSAQTTVTTVGSADKFPMTDASGNVTLITKDNLKAAMDLSGAVYQNILERAYSGLYRIESTKWIRIAETNNVSGVIKGPTLGVSGLLFLNRGYGNNDNESYVFSINVVYGGKVSIVQLSGLANTRLITKIRVTGTNDVAYIDVYYQSTLINTLTWTTVGNWKSLTAATEDPAESTYTTEFNTGTGFKSTAD